jgi:hypothetical protein
MSKHDTVTEAQAVISSIERKRELAVELGTALADERASVALAAHTGDAKAAKRLEEIHQAIAVHGSELASLDAALRAAGERLQKARDDVARERDRVQALELRKEIEALGGCGLALDKALALVVEASHELTAVLGRIHRLGASYPTDAQLMTLGHVALVTALGGTPWSNKFEHLAPGQRKTFAALVDGWSEQLARNVAERLGETDETPLEAA